ncbi:hypothetical protein [Aestuariivirga sp.]|uniref:hypothetical protein n=1 Tax=Aestuariivirga sp. TaxID=2650926 RepID=UPI003BAA7149
MTDLGHSHTGNLAAQQRGTALSGPTFGPPDVVVFLLILAQIWGPLAAGAFLHS